MKPKWLLEKDTFEENLQEIQNAIVSQGMEYDIVDYIPFEGMKFDNKYDPNVEDCIISYGSLGLAKQIQKKTKWIPGSWCDFNKFKCSYYYPRFCKYLLNSPYILVPYGDLIRQKDFLLKILGMDNCLFMRPNNGDKSFTGKVVNCDDEEYRKDIELFGFYDIEPEDLVLISQPQLIFGEYRLVVVEQEVVAASLYKNKGKLISEEGAPDEVWELAREIAQVWQPEPAWVIDIAHSLFGYKLIEINSFSCSGLYACNKEVVVERVSKAALNEWKEYQLDEGE